MGIIEQELNRIFFPQSTAGGQLYGYQREGVEFFKQSGGRAINADKPGLGKSAQALTYIKETNKERSLVVCPATMKYVWEDEVKKWTDLDCCVLSSKDKIIPALQHDIFIINYDILKTLLNQLMSVRWDIIVGDEGHYCKSSKSIRTKCFKMITKNCPEVIFLTGTPILSRPVELFNLLNIIDKKTWSNWWNYCKRYCALRHTRFGLDVSGASNLDELHQRIKKYFISRTKEEVLKELPQKRIIHVPVNLPTEYQSQYNIALEDFKKYLREIKLFTDKETQKSLQAEKLVRMGYLRQIASIGKIKYIKEMIDNILDNGEKVVVFSSYNEPLQKLKETYKELAVLLVGSTPSKQRKEIVDSFQGDENIRIFLGGIVSAGTGITLTAASTAIFIDQSWVPAHQIQAGDRIHRIGQAADLVTIYQFYAKNTIDEYMRDVLEEKQHIINRIMDGGLNKEKQISIFDDVFVKLVNS